MRCGTIRSDAKDFLMSGFPVTRYLEYLIFACGAAIGSEVTDGAKGRAGSKSILPAVHLPDGHLIDGYRNGRRRQSVLHIRNPE
jgi:hypothetical protein